MLTMLKPKGNIFLIVVDSHSKWLEALPMSSTTSAATIGALRSLFARYGLPFQLVSDNGPQFRSDEFQTFLKANDVKHTLTPPYHPASNGLAERNVQTFKNAFAKSTVSSLTHKVASVLFHLRNTPNTTTGKTPAELFLGRSPRTPLSLVKPSLQRKVEGKQWASKQDRDRDNQVVRQFDLYQPVRVRNVRGGRDRWIPGTIVQIKGPRTYIVRIPGNNRRFVHSDHLIADDTVANPAQDAAEVDLPLPQTVQVPDPLPVPYPQEAREQERLQRPLPASHNNPSEVTIPPEPPNQVTTRSGRVVRPPNRLEY